MTTHQKYTSHQQIPLYSGQNVNSPSAKTPKKLPGDLRRERWKVETTKKCCLAAYHLRERWLKLHTLEREGEGRKRMEDVAKLRRRLLTHMFPLSTRFGSDVSCMSSTSPLARGCRPIVSWALSEPVHGTNGQNSTSFLCSVLSGTTRAREP